jgi:hypothetical protein
VERIFNICVRRNVELIGLEYNNEVSKKEYGSLFNSPATTAAVFQHLNNVDCLSYLKSVLQKFGNAGTF